jgi:rubrerythrin
MAKKLPEGFAEGADKLRKMQTLEEILQTASSFEETARDFYSDLQNRVSKRIRWLVEELAEEEQRHYDLLTGLVAHANAEKLMSEKVATPASDSRFSDCLHVPEMAHNPDDQDVLLYALGREQAAMEQYRALADSVQSEDIRKVFEFLANEETQHKLELEKLYYELVHSGGV